MKKYKVVLKLMDDPTKGDETTDRTYIVESDNENDAYSKALEAQDDDIEEIKYKAIFSFKVTKVN